ncbi:Hypothetical predicted protein [Pelobates cultripes]|uniref:Uncharacterized protein n=1 Tax=Pelobates cultripes TaxID=61616 RepID=A0AAD1S6E1_PELCU|nr:Hypothetical predicted protein [Pelobates cultripes]
MTVEEEVVSWDALNKPLCDPRPIAHFFGRVSALPKNYDDAPKWHRGTENKPTTGAPTTVEEEVVLWDALNKLLCDPRPIAHFFGWVLARAPSTIGALLGP